MIPYFSFNKIIIGPITLDIWWTFFVLAFLFGYFFTLKQAKKEKIKTKIAHHLTICCFLGGVIGARLGYILQFPGKYFSQPLEILKFWQGGFMSFGGVAGALIAAFLYLKLTKKLHLFFPIVDMLILIAPISIAVVRVGCALINDHQGAETSLPWGIVWPDGIIRHPVAEYLIINAIILFLILKFLKPRLKKPGQLFFSFLFLYSFSRFFLDFTRSIGTPLSDPHYFGLSITQWLSLLIMFSTVIVASSVFFKSAPDDKQTMNLKKFEKRGFKNFSFTLIELLVVAALIILVASIVLVYFGEVRARIRDTQRIMAIYQIRQGLELYYDLYGKYPGNTDNDSGGWDIGNPALGEGDTFITSLEEKGLFEKTPIDVDDRFSTRTDQGVTGYFRYFYYYYDPDPYVVSDAEICGCEHAFYLLAAALEKEKSFYGITNQIDPCNQCSLSGLDDVYVIMGMEG